MTPVLNADYTTTQLTPEYNPSGPRLFNWRHSADVVCLHMGWSPAAVTKRWLLVNGSDVILHYTTLYIILVDKSKLPPSASPALGHVSSIIPLFNISNIITATESTFFQMSVYPHPSWANDSFPTI